MTSTPAGPLDESSLSELVAALRRRGLNAEIYENEGVQYVHVSPPRSPTAGTRIIVARREGCLCFLSEWGTLLAADMASAIRRVAWLFGKR